MTIHITPQQEFSYVSFETNVPQSSYKELIIKVLKTFQPEKCVLTMFTNEVYKITRHLSLSNIKYFKLNNLFLSNRYRQVNQIIRNLNI